MEERRASDRNKNFKIISLENVLHSLQRELEREIEKAKERVESQESSMIIHIADLKKKIQFLQRALSREFAKQSAGLWYGMEKGKELFEQELERRHIEAQIGMWRYIKNSSFLVQITAPIIYSGIVFIILLDAYITACKHLCFKTLHIPMINRQGYFVFERMYLAYLNTIQKINCGYCSYGNGLMSYVFEILTKTEHLWQPEKQAKINTFALVKNANIRTIIASLILYSGIFVIILFDSFLWLYQHTCFCAYKIPIIKRGDTISFTFSKQNELNVVQMWNYALGSYAHDVISHGRKIFAETERYWCPIKHAKKILGYHNLYDEFAEFGDVEEFAKKYLEAREKKETLK